MILLLLAGPAQATLYEKGGGSGLGARAMGMGGAYSALAEDASALWWNPAGLGETNALRLDSSLGSVYEGRVRSAAFAFAYPLPTGSAAGLLWLHSFYPQAVEVNTDLLDFGGSLPLTQDQRLRLGGTFKVLFGGLRTGGDDFQGIGLDLGLRYKLPLAGNGEALALAFRIQDLDTRLQWSNGQEEQIPQSVALGAAYHLDPATAAALDLELVHSGQQEGADSRVLHLGVERWFLDMLGLRAGYLVDDRRLSAFSAGLGFKYAGWEVEYGLLGQVADLGFSHRITFSYGWPVVREVQPLQPAKPAEVTPPTPVPTPSAYQLKFKAEPLLFSPNGDGVADTTTFTLTLLAGDRSQIGSWRLILEDNLGNLVRDYGAGGFPENLRWDGRNNSGAPCLDGVYTARLLLADARERRLAQAEAQVTLKTQLTQILLQAEPENLTVIGGQPESKLSFLTLGGTDLTGVAWQLQIRDRQGRLWRTFKGGGAIPAAIDWNGRSDLQKVLPAGTYEAVLQVRDAAGNPMTDSLTFSVVRLEMGVGHDLAPKVFKPGDPKDGKVTFRLKVTPAGKVTAWQLGIRDAETGRTVRTFGGAGIPPATVVWEGKDAAGNLVKGGMYFNSQLRATFNRKNTLEGPAHSLASDVSIQDSGKALALHLTAVTFESGSAVIPLDAFKNLQQAADTIKKYAKHYRVQVKGYTDSQEAPERELELSRQRAQRVLDYLSASGKIPANLIETVGYGAANPLAPEAAASGRTKNRRVEVVLIIQK